MVRPRAAGVIVVPAFALALFILCGAPPARGGSPEAAAPPAKKVTADSATGAATADSATGAATRDDKAVEVKKGEGAKPGDGKAAVLPEVIAKPRAASKARARAADAANASAHIGEGPSPASPPPLTIAGLRDEMQHEGGPAAIDPAAPPHTKLQQMLEEVTKARTSLHEDTARLEAMLSQDGGDAAGGTPGPGGAAAPGAAKTTKNPLDVLAKALRGIKPEQAAPIVSRLDKRLAATILQRMPPADAGKILGAMKPDTAAELAAQIAARPLTGVSKR